MIAIRDSKMTSQKGGRKCGPSDFLLGNRGGTFRRFCRYQIIAVG